MIRIREVGEEIHHRGRRGHRAEKIEEGFRSKVDRLKVESRGESEEANANPRSGEGSDEGLGWRLSELEARLVSEGATPVLWVS